MPPGAHLTPNIDHDPLRCLTTTELASGLSPGARTIPAAVLPYLRSRVTMSRLSQQPSVRGRIANLAGSTPCARSRVSLEASRRGVRSTAVRAQEQVVEFFNHRGEKLVGTLRDPEPNTQGYPKPSAKPKTPVVILAHGYMSSRNSELLVRLATALARSCQLSSLRFDFSGNGDSEGTFRYGQYRSEAQELRCAKEFLEQHLDRHVVAMIGHSKGATDVLLYAAQFDDVPCIVNLAARFEVQKGVLERLGPDVLQQLEQNGKVEMQGSNHKGPFTWQLHEDDLEDRLSTDMAAACAAIKHTAVLTIHGDADADVPIKDAYKIAETIKAPHELVIIEGGDHCFTSQGAMYQLAAAVLPFVSKHAAAAG